MQENEEKRTQGDMPPEAAKTKRPLRARTVVARVFQCLGITLLAVLTLAFGASAILCLGPSEQARDLFVVSCLETSAAKFVPRIFFSEQQVQAIVDANTVQDTGEVSDGSLVELPQKDDETFDPDAITLEEVSGPTFKGKMLIVNDPSRVYVATPEAFGTPSGGLRVEEMVERDGAIAGVNGGGFLDEGGVGNGGEPLGLVISGGKLKYGDLGTSYGVIGFDTENKFVVGNMTAQEALDRGIRDAVAFGPTLIVNGEPAEVVGSGGGLNPRTAIGQRADGSVLILVVDGRQAHSLGASYKDLIDVMMQYGAVNAANLDGGSSSLMVYEGEIITTCASLYGSRKIPTAFLVK